MPGMIDLGLIVADKNMDFALRGICARPESLGIRPIRTLTKVMPGHDGGTRTSGPEVLKLWQSQVRHGVVMLDREGSGTDKSPGELEAELDDRLRSSWGDQAKAIVIAPELDGWLWGSDNALRQVFECDFPDIRGWLAEHGFQFDQHRKPVRPKEAIKFLLDELKQERSSSNYQKITAQLSLPRCVDPAFVRFREVLQGWFPLQT